MRHQLCDPRNPQLKFELHVAIRYATLAPSLTSSQMKVTAVLVALAAGVSGFAPVQTISVKTAVNSEPDLGKGGMADTRDPEPFVNENDPRQSISAAPSFEEYLKQRAAEGN